MFQEVKVRRFLLFWFTAYICILAGVFALAFWYLSSQKRSAMELAEYQIQNTSQQFAAYIGSQLRVVDLALLSIIEMEGFKKNLLAHDISTLSQLTNRRAPLFPNTLNLQFVDAQGKLLFWRGAEESLVPDMADRSFFKEQRDSLLSFQTFLYPPDSPKPQLYMSRRVEDGKGHFLGLLVVCVSVSEMMQQYWENQVRSPDFVVLYDAAFQVLASWDALENRTGVLAASFPRDTLFSAAGESFYLKGGTQLLSTDKAVLATTQLARFPFHVGIAGATSRLLSHWRESARVMALLLVFSTVGITLGLVYAGRQFVKRSDMEAELHLVRLREALYNAMFTENPSMQLLIEPGTGRIVDANPSACRFYGFDKRQKPHGYLDAVELSESPLCTLLQDVKRAAEHPQCRLRHRVANGGIRDVEAFMGNITIENATFIHAIIYDITPRIQAETALTAAKARAEEANEAKSTFLASMSHDIRTPLNGVLGMLQLLQDTSLTDQQAELADMAVQASKRLNQLLSDILDLSKVEAGKMTLQEVIFSLADVRGSVLEIFGHMGEQKGLQVSFEMDERLPDHLIGDDSRLRQILFNLVGNAMKFTSEGSVHVEAGLAGWAKDNDLVNVAFIVADTGSGIPRKKLQHIFDPFEQAQNAHLRHASGFGLGLAIVSRLVDLMGGVINVASEEGGGTTFRVVLPFREGERQEGPAKEQNAHGESRSMSCGLRILLAEDDHVSQLLVVRLLEKRGYQVSVVENGSQALQALEGGEFDLVLMDVQMPVMDGITATKAIRAGRGNLKPDIPIIALTAYAMANEQKKILQAGMDACLAKPVEMETLVQAISRICEGKRT